MVLYASPKPPPPPNNHKYIALLAGMMVYNTYVYNLKKDKYKKPEFKLK